MSLKKYRISFVAQSNMGLQVLGTEIKDGDRVDLKVCVVTAKITDERVTINIEPKMRTKFTHVHLDIPDTCGKDERLFFNGYQSWTFSREYGRKVRNYGLNRIPFGKKAIRHFGLDRYGDCHFIKYTGKRGMNHGWSYCYYRRGENYRLYASLSERSGFTKFVYDKRLNYTTAVKEDFTAEKAWQAFDIATLNGSENEVFDKWFDMMGIPAPKVSTMRGYTSWYNHYQDISEDIIAKDFDGMEKLPLKADIFQIDDGWQYNIGDWLKVKQDRFPNGMKAQADAIHERGMKAGLWLAPFVCETNSDIYKAHPDWIINGEDGKPYSCGSNWSGFYALNIYNQEVRAYLKEVFDTILNEWGFDMVKLDFLYGACILPLYEKTRGEIMCDGMDFLRELVGDKLILGCGVPLMPAFGKVDFCRIGCDMGLDWDDTFIMRRTHPERISTKQTICDTVFRRQLNGRAFMNDPDVFLLRDSNMKLSEKEKRTLARINGLFGGLLFTSDNAAEYDSEKLELYKEICSLHDCEHSVNVEDKYFTVTYKYNGTEHKIKIKTGR